MKRFLLNGLARKTAKPRVLFVDDDELIQATFSAALRGAGYEVVQAHNGLEAVALAAGTKPALVLLDVDMPGADGWTTMATLRDAGFRQPIIMLTGRTEIDDRVRGLSGGADDYLCKPCDIRELLARVHTALRRSQPEPTEPRMLRFGPARVDLDACSASIGDQALRLTKTEYAILGLFAQHPGQLVTRGTMLKSIWGYAQHSSTRTVDTHIWRLRRKLGDNPDEPRWIQTVPAGDGYRLVCDLPLVFDGVEKGTRNRRQDSIELT